MAEADEIATDLDAGTANASTPSGAFLIVSAPDGSRLVPLREGMDVVLGRGSQATVSIQDPRASRSHASFRWVSGALVVEDLGSRNGTRVGDRTLCGERAVVRGGDRIRIGAVEIVVAAATRGQPSVRAHDLDEELDTLTSAARGSTLLRIACGERDEEAVLDAIAALGDVGLFDQRCSGEYVLVLAAGGRASTIASRLRAAVPAAQITSARLGEDGATVDELFQTATARAREERTLAELSDSMVFADPSMVSLLGVVRRLAAAPTTVLIQGETGSGKEIVAEALHRLSPRAAGRFVRVDCGAIVESLLESELFGHEKGAFTGADRARTGHFEEAHGGTLFLDEIGELSPSTQAKLLRVLEARVVTRVGSSREVPVDVRVIVATHRDLVAATRAGTFREDLYYRVATSTLRVPPLRERRVEIPLLADHFARRFATRLGRQAPVLHASVSQALTSHDWPGNVRELRNAIEHAVALSEGPVVLAEHLPEALRSPSAARPRPLSPLRNAVADAEQKAILEALASTGGNRTHAARALGMPRRTLVYKLAKYGIGRRES